MAIEETKRAELKSRRRDWLLQQPGVLRVERDLDHAGLPCLKIVVHELSAETRQMILAKLRGTPVIFRESGSERPTNGTANGHAGNGHAPQRS